MTLLIPKENKRHLNKINCFIFQEGFQGNSDKINVKLEIIVIIQVNVETQHIVYRIFNTKLL